MRSLSSISFAAAAALALISGAPAAAVNLVPNPSFESYSTCPDSLSEIDRAVPWDTPTAASPDYYNSCATSGSGVSVPSNTFGSQLARTGQGYAGIICRPVNDYREYVEVALSQPLTAGDVVRVEFWVSLADGARDAIDQIGAYLSNGSVGPVTSVSALPYTPQVESPGGTFLDDKTLWIKISGTFTAAGGEDHITIGNFHDNATTNVETLSGFYPGSYYYIDDVSVESLGPAPGAIPALSGLGLLVFAGLLMISGAALLWLRR